MRTFIGGMVAALVVAAFLFVAGWGAWQARELARLRERERAGSLAADSFTAARDTTRAVLFSGRTALGDSVRVYQRRIVQMKQRGDSLDRVLGLERAARYRVEASVSVLESRLVAPVADTGDDVRTAEFGVREAPYTIEAAVDLPRPPGEARLALRVALDTAVFEARVGCGPPDGFGVRPATLTLAGPRWVTVRLTRLEQEVRVCSPGGDEALVGRSSFLVRLARGFRVGVGYSAVIAPDGRIVRGPGVTVAWSPWP